MTKEEKYESVITALLRVVYSSNDYVCYDIPKRCEKEGVSFIYSMEGKEGSEMSEGEFNKFIIQEIGK